MLLLATYFTNNYLKTTKNNNKILISRAPKMQFLKQNLEMVVRDFKIGSRWIFVSLRVLLSFDDNKL